MADYKKLAQIFTSTGTPKTPTVQVNATNSLNDSDAVAFSQLGTSNIYQADSNLDSDKEYQLVVDETESGFITPSLLPTSSLARIEASSSLFNQASAHDVIKIEHSSTFRGLSIFLIGESQPKQYFLGDSHWFGDGTSSVDVTLQRPSQTVLQIDGNSTTGSLDVTGQFRVTGSGDNRILLGREDTDISGEGIFVLGAGSINVADSDENSSLIGLSQAGGFSNIFSTRTGTGPFNDLRLFTSGSVQMKLTTEGVTEVTGDLNVSGSIFDDGVQVSDFVFGSGYELMPIADMTKFYKSKKHLPTIGEYKEKPPVGEIISKLWETVEVQSRYISELNSRLEEVEKNSRD